MDLRNLTDIVLSHGHNDHTGGLFYLKQLYQDFYGKPLSDLAEKMLHTIYTDRSDGLSRGETKM